MPGAETLAPIFTIVLMSFGGSHQIYLLWKKRNSDQVSILKLICGCVCALIWAKANYAVEASIPALHLCKMVGLFFSIAVFLVVLLLRIPKFKSKLSQ